MAMAGARLNGWSGEGLAGVPAMAAFLWPVVSVRMRNLRNRYAREHPLWILKAVFLSAIRACGCGRRPFLFHPVAEPWGERIRLGRVYDIELAFPGWPLDEVGRFREGLASWLADESHNFTVESMGGVASRSWAEAAARVAGKLDPASDELCLDFLTPFGFSGPEPDERGVRWRIEAAHFAGCVERRLAELGLPGLPPGVLAAFHGLRVLPWYWAFERHAHRPKTHAGDGGSRRQDLMGMQGPLYLRGCWAEILPWLALCSELHLGNRIGNGAGRFVLHTGRTFFDREIGNPARYLEVCRGMREDAEEDDDGFLASIDDDMTLAAGLAKDAISGTFRPAPAKIFSVPKRSGGTRRVGSLSPRDRALNRSVHLILQPYLDRVLGPAAIGFRPGHSTKDTTAIVAAALREGFTHAVETDIESFFDSIAWDRLDGVLGDILPRADRRTMALVGALFRAPVEEGGVVRERERGVLQGSPLSPLLANLFLADFDRAIGSRDRRLIRFGDDLIILTRGPEEAERALADVGRELERRGLGMKLEKTAITSLREGLDFLGLRLDADLAGEWVEHASLRMPVFVGDLRVMLGVDGETIVARKGGELLARYPMYRVSHLVVMGTDVLSTRLLAVCARRGIPVSLCEPHGAHILTIAPQRRSAWERAAKHHARRNAADPGEEIRVARRIVEAKACNYLAWLEQTADPAARRATETAQAFLDQLMAEAPPESMEAVRGWEGRIARELFRPINGLAKDTFFLSEGREPRAKRDPYNLLLDFAYHMLFARLDVLIRGQGLNPWLGFLHSPDNPYESLVCDLQEPFRARMDRLVVRTINRGIVQPSDFERVGEGRWRLKSHGAGQFFGAFEREMNVRLASDPGSLRRLLVGQVLAVAAWVEDGQDLRFFRQPRQHSRMGRPPKVVG